MDTQGSRLKKIRQSLNLSQEQFGEIFGITKQFVSLLEKDKAFLNNDKLVKLLIDYNVNLNFLLGGIGQPFNSAKLEDVKDEILKEVNEVLAKYGVKKL